MNQGVISIMTTRHTYELTIDGTYYDSMDDDNGSKDG